MKIFKKIMLSAVSAAALIGVMAFGASATSVNPPASNTSIPMDRAIVSVSTARVDGTAHTANVTVMLDGKLLVEGKDYTVESVTKYAYGTYPVTVKGIGAYAGEAYGEFKILKGADGKIFAKAKPAQLKPVAKKAKFSAKALKKAQKVTKIIYTVHEKGKTKVTFEVTKFPKGGKKFITVKEDGTVVLKKGAPVGNYVITVKSAGTVNYKAATKTVVIKVK